MRKFTNINSRTDDYDCYPVLNYVSCLPKKKHTKKTATHQERELWRNKHGFMRYRNTLPGVYSFYRVTPCALVPTHLKAH